MRRVLTLLLGAVLIAAVVVVTLRVFNRDGKSQTEKAEAELAQESGFWAACGPQEARGAFVSFLSNFNRGDYATLDSLFAEQPTFSWYSSGPPEQRYNRQAKDRSTLIPYFRRRHANRERFRLARLDLNTGALHLTGLIFVLLRSAADFGGGGWFQVEGKGAVTCHEGTAKLIAVSLGDAH